MIININHKSMTQEQDGKRITVYLDKDSVDYLEERKEKGVSFSFTLRAALLAYREFNRSHPTPPGASLHVGKKVNDVSPLSKIAKKIMETPEITPGKKLSMEEMLVAKADGRKAGDKL